LFVFGEKNFLKFDLQEIEFLKKFLLLNTKDQFKIPFSITQSQTIISNTFV